MTSDDWIKLAAVIRKAQRYGGPIDAYYLIRVLLEEADKAEAKENEARLLDRTAKGAE